VAGQQRRAQAHRQGLERCGATQRLAEAQRGLRHIHALTGGDGWARPWWHGAVFYQIYVRSFADSNDDGIGDLPGITSRLEYLKRLGVDAIWITPFYPSPQKDHGYDIADYFDVNPEYGTLVDFDNLVERAHELRLKVLIDLVPNHTSDQHPWFQAALSTPDDPHRGLYYFADAKPDGSPPNNWESVFGGSAWAKDERSGQCICTSLRRGSLILAN
jgi:alpha-glucosidase